MKTINKLTSALLFVTILFVLCACRMVVVAREFHIKNITDHLDEDYFTSEHFEFAKVDSVVIFPYIKEVNRGFDIWICVYSKTGEEKVIIKDAELKENDNLLLHYDFQKELQFKKIGNELFEGEIDGREKYDNVFFTEEQVEIVDGKVYNLTVSVEVLKGDVTISQSVTFECEVALYKSFPMR